MSRNPKPFVIKSHQEDINRYASTATKLREEIAGYKTQIKMIQSRRVL